MSTTDIGTGTSSNSEVGTIDMKLEVVTLPVSDVDRAKRFYESLGWRLDADFVLGDEIRAVQFTPPRSNASISFGKGLTTAEPGSAQRFELVVSDTRRRVTISSAAASRSASCSTSATGGSCQARTRSVAPT